MPRCSCRLPFRFRWLSLAVVSLISLLMIHPLLVLVARRCYSPPCSVLSRRLRPVAVEEPAARAQEAMIGRRLGHRTRKCRRRSWSSRRMGRAGRRGRIDSPEAVADVLRDRATQESARYQAVYSNRPSTRCPTSGILVLLLIGAWLVEPVTRRPVGEIVQARWPCSTSSPCLIQILGYLFQQMPRSVVAMDRIDRVFWTRNSRTLPDRSTTPCARSRWPWSFDDLTFGYPLVDGTAPTPVLDGLISLARIEPGESVALVGAQPVRGRAPWFALLAGMVSRLPAGRVLTRWRRRRRSWGRRGVPAVVAPVFQETFLFADTVREQPDPRPSGAPTPNWNAFSTWWPPMGSSAELPAGHRHGGGRARRDPVGRTAPAPGHRDVLSYDDPGVLVLDDATSAVDPIVEAEILVQPAGRTGCRHTLLVVAHRLATIRLADRVLFLQGRPDRSRRYPRANSWTIPDYAALIRAYEGGGSDELRTSPDEDTGAAVEALEGADVVGPWGEHDPQWH